MRGACWLPPLLSALFVCLCLRVCVCTHAPLLQFGPYHSVPVQEVVGRVTDELHTLDLSRFGYGPHDLSLIRYMSTLCVGCSRKGHS